MGICHEAGNCIPPCAKLCGIVPFCKSYGTDRGMLDGSEVGNTSPNPVANGEPRGVDANELSLE